MSTTIPRKLATMLLAELIATGDRLEADNDPSWYAVARTAGLIESLLAGTNTPDAFAQQAAGLVGELERIVGDRSENQPHIAIALQSAIVIIDAIRLGLATLETPIWIGIDLAAGRDQTVRRTFHA